MAKAYGLMKAKVGDTVVVGFGIQTKITQVDMMGLCRLAATGSTVWHTTELKLVQR